MVATMKDAHALFKATGNHGFGLRHDLGEQCHAGLIEVIRASTTRFKTKGADKTRVHGLEQAAFFGFALQPQKRFFTAIVHACQPRFTRGIQPDTDIITKLPDVLKCRRDHLGALEVCAVEHDRDFQADSVREVLLPAKQVKVFQCFGTMKQIKDQGLASKCFSREPRHCNDPNAQSITKN